ncbi:50S ribosomal protein L4 [Streptococcus anginosus]|nr:50S ribosomal protein L4 [Streptococcus anginosus]
MLAVIDADNQEAARAARNLAKVTVVDEKNVNVYDLVNNEKVIITQSALSDLEEVLA